MKYLLIPFPKFIQLIWFKRWKKYLFLLFSLFKYSEFAWEISENIFSGRKILFAFHFFSLLNQCDKMILVFNKFKYEKFYYADNFPCIKYMWKGGIVEVDCSKSWKSKIKHFIYPADLSLLIDCISLLQKMK